MRPWMLFVLVGVQTVSVCGDLCGCLCIYMVCVCLCLLEIHAYPCYLLNPSKWRCGSLLPTGLLDLATLTNLIDF